MTEFRQTSVVDDCALLATAQFMIDSFGFMYCPAGGPAALDHIGGGLYQWNG